MAPGWTRVAGVLLGAVAARGAYAWLRRRPPGDPDIWRRTNHRGHQVTLLEGPACAMGAATGFALSPALPGRVRLAGCVGALGAGFLGGYDDVTGSADARGFAGHLGALRRGHVTSGSVKLVGIGLTGLGCAALLPCSSHGVSRGADTVLAGAVIAGGANLMNLFDLRPGRALKVGLVIGASLLVGPGSPRHGAAAAAPVGVALVLLPDDLGERAMLGDAGANALGAALGVAAVAGLGRRGRLALLAGVSGLTAASEVLSFSKVIDATGPLRWLDHLGRLQGSGRSRSALGSDRGGPVSLIRRQRLPLVVVPVCGRHRAAR